MSSKFVDTASISEKSWGKKKFDWKFESVTQKDRKSKKNFKALWNPKPKKKILDTVSNLCGTFPIKIWSKLTNLQKFQILKTYPLKILFSYNGLVLLTHSPAFVFLAGTLWGLPKTPRGHLAIFTPKQSTHPNNASKHSSQTHHTTHPGSIGTYAW